MTGTAPTRDRLLGSAMRLFAEHGFDATSVGDIEAAAGLQPRRGALYKHFSSKQALLEAAVQTHLDSAAAGASALGDLGLATLERPDDDVLRQMLTGIGRWFLDEMDRLENLTRLLEHDGGRLAELVDEVRRDIVDLSYRSAVSLIDLASPGAADAEAAAVLLLGSLVALRRTAWTFGAPALDIDDDRALAEWVELTLGVLDRGG